MGTGLGRPADHRGTGGRMGSVDVLIVTALPVEFDAAREVMGGAWAEQDAGGTAPHLIGEHRTARGGRLTVALARPTAMGPRRTAPIATTLTDRHRPTCLAMSGVCAGNPDDTVAGDVVVAAQAYQWDEGRQAGPKFWADQQQYPLNDRWLRAAQDLEPAGLPSFGVAGADEATVWLLERLQNGQDARNHPARPRYFPKGTWSERLTRLEADGLVAWRTGGWELTPAGSARITRILDDPDGPGRLPFAVHAGPMASGGKVIQDPRIWTRLKETGVRKILALEMEAATIATIAHEREVPQWLVAKGVMDHADFAKDDRFKEFAARASAEVLFALLGDLLDGDQPPPPVPAGHPGAAKVAFSRRLGHDWQDLADVVGIPGFDRPRFARGEEARAVWEWLEVRNRLGELPAALAGIGRADLAELLRPVTGRGR
jgi:nucleoside phosphorylase